MQNKSKRVQCENVIEGNFFKLDIDMGFVINVAIYKVGKDKGGGGG